MIDYSTFNNKVVIAKLRLRPKSFRKYQISPRSLMFIKNKYNFQLDVSGMSKCDPRDKFDLEYGKKVAKDKAIKKYNDRYTRILQAYVNELKFLMDFTKSDAFRKNLYRLMLRPETKYQVFENGVKYYHEFYTSYIDLFLEAYYMSNEGRNTIYLPEILKFLNYSPGTIKFYYNGFVKCSEEDTFDRNTGMSLATKRLLKKINKNIEVLIREFHTSLLNHYLHIMDTYKTYVHKKNVADVIKF